MGCSIRAKTDHCYRNRRSDVLDVGNHLHWQRLDQAGLVAVTPIAGVIAGQVLVSHLIGYVQRQDRAAALGCPAGGLTASLTQDVIWQRLWPALLPVSAEVLRGEALCEDAGHVLPLRAVIPNAVRHDLSMGLGVLPGLDWWHNQLGRLRPATV